MQASCEAVVAGAVAKFAPAVGEVRRTGPRAALTQLLREKSGQRERSEWVEQARVDALLGSCPRSHDSFLSGIRCWAAFAQRALDRWVNILDTRPEWAHWLSRGDVVAKNILEYTMLLEQLRVRLRRLRDRERAEHETLLRELDEDRKRKRERRGKDLNEASSSRRVRPLNLSEQF